MQYSDRQTQPHPHPSLCPEPDSEGVEQVAEEAIRQRGFAAVLEFNERAEIADGIGDEFAARTWREIAAAAARMLRAG